MLRSGLVSIGARENTVEEQKQVVTDTAKQLSADEKTAAPLGLTACLDCGREFSNGQTVRTRISDNRYTELVEGDVSAEEDLVVGEKPKL